MRIIVLGPESSGGNWITSLISAHPNCPRIEHASYPAGGDTIMPDYEGQDVTDVVLCLRDWNITRMSHKAHSYLDENRQNRENVETELIREAILKQLDCRRVHCVSYEGLCGPFGRLVLSELLIHLGLLTATYPWETFIPQDGNRKYLK